MKTLIVLMLVLAGADATNAFDQFFEDFAKKRDKIHVVEARFTQETVSPEEILHSAGSIVYVKPRRIVFKYEDPSPTYLIDDTRVYEYEPDIMQLQIHDIKDNPEMEVFFLGFDDNTDALRTSYAVELFEPVDGSPDSRGIVLRPKEGEAANFQEARLYLRDADYLPHKIHIVNDADSEVTIVVSDFEINQPVDAAKTQIALAGGTKIIDNDEVVEKTGEGGKRVPEAVHALPLEEESSSP